MTFIGWEHLFFALVVVGVIAMACVDRDRRAMQAWNARVVALVWVCTVIVISAVRQVRFPSDMAVYVVASDRAPSYDSAREFIVSRGSDPGFSTFQYLLAQLSTDQRLVMGAIAAAILVLFWLAIRSVLPPVPAVVVLFATSIAPFFAFYVANTARQGIAVALVVYAACAVCRDTHCGRLLAALLLVIAASVHVSAVLPGAVVVVMMVRVPSLRSCVTVWIASAVLYLTGINARIMSGLPINNERFAQYAEAQVVNDYAGGTNRLDFLAVSAVLIFAVRWLHLHNSADGRGEDRVGRVLVCSFVLFNSVFLCLGFLAYSDRTAAYSWLMAPVVVGYLLLGPNTPNTPRRAPVGVAFVLGVCAITFAVQGWPALLERLPIIG